MNNNTEQTRTQIDNRVNIWDTRNLVVSLRIITIILLIPSLIVFVGDHFK